MKSKSSIPSSDFMFIYDHILAYDIIECYLVFYQNILYVCLPRNSKSARKTNIKSRERIWPWLISLVVYLFIFFSGFKSCLQVINYMFPNWK